MRKIGICSLVAGSLVAVTAIVAILLAIWTGDDRWGSTGAVAAFTGLALVVVGILLVQP